jgi:citrate synthase
VSDAPTQRSALAARRTDGRAWWETAISEVSDGRIIIRGRPIEELIAGSSFVQHLVFLACGRMLTPGAARLFEAVMVAGADHGPLAPSIAAARMAATCGVTFNSAVASGINLLGEDHGGAAGNSTRLLTQVDARSREVPLETAALERVTAARAAGTRLAGFGHQLHGTDPRREPLLAMLAVAVAERDIDGHFVDVALAIEAALYEVVGQPVTLNVDGLWGIVCCELELSPDFAMGAFCLSRGAGIVAHALEEGASGLRIKGPCPPEDRLVSYVGEMAGPTPPNTVSAPRPDTR